MRILFVFIIMCSTAQAAFLSNLQYTKTSTSFGAEIVLTWDLDLIGQNIGIFRGSEYIATLPGNITTWEITETGYGIYDYTVVWIWNWQTVHLYYEWLQASVNVGELMWDPPVTIIPDGYLIYLSQTESVFGPEPVLQIGFVNSLSLFDLMPFFTPEENYYVAIASFKMIGLNMAVSSLLMNDNQGIPVSFSYVDKSWELLKPEPGINYDIKD